ncbi:unnamed protein product [Macrosiphum euphorbiae]|uniref:Uncharacterized protein n=1 Tax=Macrosiphum euphorbiae TaxID=13131 RepID=A0AAV0Y6W9_9HEMI|nr:unnamed protein product [Macrosiphum euphorbiae]
MDIRSFLSKKKSDEDNASAVLEPHTSRNTSVSAQNDRIAQKRNFKIEWLKQYRWLVYSRHLKGGLCKHCVVFRLVVKRGLLGTFIIVSEFTKYKDFHFHLIFLYHCLRQRAQ